MISHAPVTFAVFWSQGMRWDRKTADTFLWPLHNHTPHTHNKEHSTSRHAQWHIPAMLAFKETEAGRPPKFKVTLGYVARYFLKYLCVVRKWHAFVV